MQVCECLFKGIIRNTEITNTEFFLVSLLFTWNRYETTRFDSKLFFTLCFSVYVLEQILLQNPLGDCFWNYKQRHHNVAFVTNDHGVVFRTQPNICCGAFMWKQLTAKSLLTMRLFDGDKLNTRKATGFKSPQINCWKINQVAPKWQIYFMDKTCKKGLK